MKQLNRVFFLPPSLEKNKPSVYTCRDPASINIHLAGQHPQNMPQERRALCSSGGGRPAALLSNQRLGIAKHMLAVLWLELAS